MPCLYVFVSLVFVLAASATSQHNTPQQVGVRIKTAPRQNDTCCKDLSVNAFIDVRATHLTGQVASLPLAKNAKHSSSNTCVIIYSVYIIIMKNSATFEPSWVNHAHAHMDTQRAIRIQYVGIGLHLYTKWMPE